MPERTQANHEEMNFHFSRPHTALTIALLDEIGLMNCDVIFFTDEVYEVRKLHQFICKMINPKPLSGSSIVDVQIT